MKGIKEVIQNQDDDFFERVTKKHFEMVANIQEKLAVLNYHIEQAKAGKFDHNVSIECLENTEIFLRQVFEFLYPPAAGKQDPLLPDSPKHPPKALN